MRHPLHPIRIMLMCTCCMVYEPTSGSHIIFHSISMIMSPLLYRSIPGYLIGYEPKLWSSSRRATQPLWRPADTPKPTPTIVWIKRLLPLCFRWTRCSTTYQSAPDCACTCTYRPEVDVPVGPTPLSQITPKLTFSFHDVVGDTTTYST